MKTFFLSTEFFSEKKPEKALFRRFKFPEKITTLFLSN